MTPAEKIKFILREHNLTQVALAAAYGCGPGPMSQFLSGARPVPDWARMIVALSAILPDGYSAHMTREISAKRAELNDDIWSISVMEPWPDDEI